MGYPTISNFDKVFISRTIENLNQAIPYSFTHLLNSLLGLIVLPRQWSFQGRRELKFLNKTIDDYDELKFLKEETYYCDEEGTNIKIKKLEFKHLKKVNLTIEILLGRLRHSITHQAIRPTKDGNIWRGVIFRNYPKEGKTVEWGDNYNLQLYLTEHELKIFSEFIARKYLEEIPTAD